MQSLAHVVKLSLVLLWVMAALIPPLQPLAAKAATTEISHVWRFTYQHQVGTGTLDVMIVEIDADTHEILDILEQFTFPVPCRPTVNGVDCDLNIRGAILHSYAQLKISASVPAAESYKWMIVEASGQWSTPLPKAHTLLADHPSLKFAVASTTGKQASFSTIWNSTTSTSQPYKVVAGSSYTMKHDFDYEETIGGVIENTVFVDGIEKELGTATYPNLYTVGFLLAPAQIQIRLPTGFQLDTFVIDPGKPGYA